MRYDGIENQKIKSDSDLKSMFSFLVSYVIANFASSHFNIYIRLQNLICCVVGYWSVRVQNQLSKFLAEFPLLLDNTNITKKDMSSCLQELQFRHRFCHCE